MTIAPEFREFAECLNANNVRYLIVGGYAVAFHGHPRYTKDLDVWIDRTRENIRGLMRALDDFGFGSVGLKAGDFMKPDQVIQLGYPPLRIDLLTSLTGVDFDTCWIDRQGLSVRGVGLPIIGLEGLRANKTASGRHQDLADLENLEHGHLGHVGAVSIAANEESPQRIDLGPVDFLESRELGRNRAGGAGQ
jgi:hypothetical protein